MHYGYENGIRSGEKNTSLTDAPLSLSDAPKPIYNHKLDSNVEKIISLKITTYCQVEGSLFFLIISQFHFLMCNSLNNVVI
jgi:hypothetical protein